MVVGQDWGNEKLLAKTASREDESNPTNSNLVELLDHIGIPISVELQGQQDALFMTNAVLCIRCKDESMQKRFKERWLRNCATNKKFLKMQIDLVKPKVVVGLGQKAFFSILRSFDIKPSKKFREYVRDKSGVSLSVEGPRAFAVYHCGAWGRVNRKMIHQRGDWKRIGAALKTNG
jgi:DNA polymerase